MAELTKEEKEVVARIRAANGGILGGLRTLRGDLVLVRRASPEERTRFVTECTGKDKQNGAANPHKALALNTIVYPEKREDVELLLREFAFLCEDAADKAVTLASAKDVDLGEA